MTPHSQLAPGLELGVRYHSYLWEPSLGIKLDLGAVECPAPGALIRHDTFDDGGISAWTETVAGKSARRDGKLYSAEGMLSVANGFSETNLVAAVDAHSNAEAGLILRFQDADNYLSAVYSPKEKAVYLVDRQKGLDGPPLGSTPVPDIVSTIRLTAEVRGAAGAVSVTDGERTYRTPIVTVDNTSAGGAGLMHRNDGATQVFDNFELRRSPTLVRDDHLERKLYDARGTYRGEMTGPEWETFGRNKLILLDAYRPEKLPFPQDWVLVLEARK